MARMKEVDVDLEAADLDGIADNNSSSTTTVALDGILTSGGVFTSADGLGRIITIKDSDTDTQSDVTFTVTGTDANDNALEESGITGPASAATVVTTKFFKTVTAITVSAAQGGTEKVDVGTRDTTLCARSQVVPLNYTSQIAATVAVDITGTMNFDVQETFDDVLGNAATDYTFYDVSALSGKTADTVSQISVGATGVRLEVNTYSATAEAQMRIIQSNS